MPQRHLTPIHLQRIDTFLNSPIEKNKLDMTSCGVRKRLPILLIIAEYNRI
jgi:hypothetical protein